MSPTDNTPDFDNMSPEELMAWMETLAERQGAVEGFTTEKRVDIAEVDPDTVEDTGPGYIPYGMTQEEWAKRQAKEETEKQERLAQRAQQRATPPPAVPEEVAPDPVPEPVAAAPAAGGEPDFDNMSPEELMAWMETLAERQGAVEGFTTEKRVDIAEVDPDTAEDTGPGYIPYGMTQEEWAKRQVKEEAEKQERLAQRAQQRATPPPASIPEPEPEEEEIEPASVLDDFALPSFEEAGAELFDSSDFTPTPTAEEPAAETGGLDWLENLASEQGADFPEMDLSGLGDEISNLDLSGLGGLEGLGDDTSTESTDPMEWLQDMANEQGAGEVDFGASADDSDDDDGDVDPIEWLESLAARQDNPPSSDEFMTDANLDIPVPDAMDETQAPGYEDFQFETPDVSDSVALPDIDSLDVVASTDPEDPVAWLDSLAASQSYADEDEVEEIDFDLSEDIADTEDEDKAIIDKLNQGISDPAEMENWMSALLDKGANRDDVVSDYIDEDEDDAIEAQIPDWLIEQVGTPPEFIAGEEDDDEPVAAEDVQLPLSLEDVDVDEAEIPDWLLEDEAEDIGEHENIFAGSDIDEPALADLMDDNVDIDTSDPWVEAFEEERTQDGVPDWYVAKLAETQTDGEAVLEPADFEEEMSLNAGEPEALPSWLDTSDVEQAPAPAFEMEDVVDEAEPADVSWLSDLTDDEPADMADLTEGDIPDWLKEQVSDDEEIVEATSEQSWLADAAIDKIDTIPDWLLDTVGDSEEFPAVASEEDVFEVTSTPEPTPRTIVPAATVSPAPTPPPAVDVQEALQSARSKIEGDNLEGALQDYESVVRANSGIDAVINDLSELIKKPRYKDSAAIYRVLGDGLMRKGDLQTALDTYRKALNLL